MIGEILGSYKVVRKIGEGGMGEVFLAEHQHIDRRAAIKVLRPQYSANADLVQRFFAEARSANLVKHSGIVEIFDCALHPSGNAYIVMEYLEGQTLGAALNRLGCVDDAMGIVDISWQIASALQAAHEKNIIHRDLKPDNIFLSPPSDSSSSELKPLVKVLDFGIAKLTHRSIKATETGSLLGTPLYMSPEQGRGSGPVDHRTDIYSLGCIMFEMACGRPPFVREGAGELIIAHASEMAPPASTIQPSLPPELDNLISQMLAKHPDRRPQTMKDVSAVLDLFRIRRSAIATTLPAESALEAERVAQLNHRNSAAPEGWVRPTPVAPTELLPPSEREKLSPRSVIQGQIYPEDSWVVRAYSTSNQTPKPAFRQPHARKPEVASTQAPAPSPIKYVLIFGIGGGVILGLFVLILLLQWLPKQPEAAASHPPPRPVLVMPPPPVEPIIPLPAQSVTSDPPAKKIPAPPKAKRRLRHFSKRAIPKDDAALAKAMVILEDTFQQGNFTAAVSRAKEAIKLGAGVKAYLLLGESLFRLERYGEAKQAFQGALAVDPNNNVANARLRSEKMPTSE